MIEKLTAEAINPALKLRYGRAKSAADVERTAVAQEGNRFIVRRAANAAEAKGIVLSLIPEGAEVAQGASQNLQLTGVTEAIEASERYKPLRPRIWAMDRQKQADEIRRLGAASDVMLGSVHTVTQTGSLMAASMSGSQLGPYASGAAHLILVVGAQKIVANLEEGLRESTITPSPRGRARPAGVWRAQWGQQNLGHQRRDQPQAASPWSWSTRSSGSEAGIASQGGVT